MSSSLLPPISAAVAGLAGQRFGFGLGPAEAGAVTANPRDWLRAQLETTPREIALQSQYFDALPGSDRTATVFPSMLRRAGLARGPSRPLMGDKAEVAAGRSDAMSGEARAVQQLVPYLRAELAARLRHAVQTPTPLLDRLVWFWSNHLTVSAQRIGLIALVGPYEREAIRPRVLGSFPALLIAAVRHPAMQIYLDNFRSVGPTTAAVGSGFGAQRRTGVNENLAREILELHTLGDRRAYRQDDVRELALALTGWGLAAGGGGFRFDPDAHESGERYLLGVRYPQSGAAQAEAMLTDLALHPATAQHLSRKLLRHFGPLDPSPDTVRRLAESYLRTRGDLRATTMALIDSEGVWHTNLPRRARHADELCAGAARALGLALPDPETLFQQLRSLGQVPWYAPSPAGWADQSLADLGPDALLARIDWAAALAQQAPATIDARTLPRAGQGIGLSAHTSRELERAASGSQAVALWLASPEFLQI